MIFSLPLPLSTKDNNALADITPDTAWFGIWLDVVVSKTNEYQDDFGNELNFVADLGQINRGIGIHMIIIKTY